MEQDLNNNYYDWLNKIREFQKYGVFFIAGAPKSGTTWIQKCLNLHPFIASDGEGHFDLLGELVHKIMVSFNKEQEGRISRAQDPRAIILDNSDFYNILKFIIDNQLAKRVIHDDIEWVGDKTPEHTKFLKTLKQFYPSAKVIHIMRDGRDCLVSWWVRYKSTEPNSNDNIEDHIEWFVKKIWVPYVQALKNFGKEHPENYLEITYEDMHTDPHKTLENILKYLPIGYTDSTIDHCIRYSRFQVLSKGRVKGQEDSSSHFRKGIIGDWKNYLNDSLHDQFLDIGGELLQELGYEI
jgi:hypothetical protein